MKFLSFACLFILFLASCSIEQRHYNPGYSVEWFSKVKPIPHSPLIASLKPIRVKTIVVPQLNLIVKEHAFASINMPLSEGKLYAKDTKQIAIADTIIKKNIEEEPELHGGNAGGLVLGILFVIGAIPAGLFLTWWAGLLLFALGIICIVSASITMAKNGRIRKQMQEDKKEQQQINQKANVVYLKNGSEIRGTILEEIPNASVKIQTSDGSIFVYDMKDVVKITSESRK